MKEKIAQLISNNVEGIEMSDIMASIEIPPRPDMGDFAFPCFRLAKVLRKAPNMIAADIKARERPYVLTTHLLTLQRISTLAISELQ